MRVSLYCPSRGRPEAARELLESFRTTRVTPDVELVFLVDDDDPTLSGYPGPVESGPPTGDPTGPLNAAVANSTSEIVGFIGDDSRFETPGWDRKVLDALGEPGICYTSEGHQKPWPSAVFISRIIPQTLGWMVPPDLHRGFFDVVWVVLGKLTGTTRILPDVMIRHDNSKGNVDPKIIAADEQAYLAWERDRSKRDAQVLRRVLYQ